MTKKRFWILNTITKYSGIKDGDKLLTFDEVVELLNALHEENRRLKEIISANRTITISYTITDEKLVKKLKEMFKEDLE